ncbi:MAG: threonine ammonia-lyase, biosynthetic [Gammaproteobacteria bacterium]|nr:threonine ammonia-lyase, biosynthetic [Gammaproteobacteria bacterium]
MPDYPYLEKIITARVYDVAIETPLDYAPMLSKRTNNNIFIKREDLQPVFSFKLRGAHNKISQLNDAAKSAGVIAASAGNHAQGVALSSQRLGIRSIIVMPKTTPQIKVSAVKHHGGEVILHGNTYDEAYLHAREIAAENGMTFIHPYDDPEVIAGQGTVAMEILKQHPDHIDAIFVPVGGGGLIAGIIAYAKRLRPETKVIGVEPDDAACLYEALKANKRVVLDSVGIFADGVAVRQIGEEPFRVIKDLVDEVILANTDEICAGIKDIFDDTRAISEPAGALAVAGMKKYIEKYDLSGKTFVAIDSGANMNFDRLRHVSERTELGENREALLAVTIPEEPGSFRKFCHSIGQRSITEFNYRYSDASDAHVFAGIKLADSKAGKAKLIARLDQDGYKVLDLSDNDMAKTHIRYMVGGHASGAENELLYRFIFPERPGALLRFLTHISQRWNISLFHYRNHGAAYGRILVGIQVPLDERNEFSNFLVVLEYPFWEETNNPAYTLFLR